MKMQVKWHGTVVSVKWLINDKSFDINRMVSHGSIHEQKIILSINEGKKVGLSSHILGRKGLYYCWVPI